MTTTRLDSDVRDAVTDVLVRYATGIDRRDWDLLRTCFTEECDADYGDIGHWRSADEITQWMKTAHEPLGPTMHQLSNIALRAEGNRVVSRAYVHGVIVTPDAANAVHAFGRYEDELVLTDDGWRIARRRFIPTTTEMHPAIGRS